MIFERYHVLSYFKILGLCLETFEYKNISLTTALCQKSMQHVINICLGEVALIFFYSVATPKFERIILPLREILPIDFFKLNIKPVANFLTSRWLYMDAPHIF